MNNTPSTPVQRRPALVTLTAVVNAAALVLTIAFWALILAKRAVPFPAGLPGMLERANAATTYGFMVGDLLWSAPLLALAAAGLWRMRYWGCLSAQVANGLWVYSMTVIWFRDAYTQPSPGGLLFLPFPFFALWSSYYLWKHQQIFMTTDSGCPHPTVRSGE